MAMSSPRQREAHGLLRSAGQPCSVADRGDLRRRKLDAGHELQRRCRRDESGDVLVAGLARLDGLLEGDERLCFGEPEVADGGARELLQVRSCVHRLADVDGQLPHVRALGAGDAAAHGLRGLVEPEHVDAPRSRPP